VDDDIHPVHRPAQPFLIPHITDEEAQPGVAIEFLAHLVLQNSPREKMLFLRLEILQGDFGELLPERSRCRR
jgi:hypothetical protein